MKTARIAGRLLGAVSLGVVMIVSAHAGDAKKGQQLFARCSVCHNDEKGAGNKVGPNLFGIVGRKAGTAADFYYSPAMKSSGIVWTEKKLQAYIMDPSKVVPGNRMAFAGISDEEQAEDLVAYLETRK